MLTTLIEFLRDNPDPTEQELRIAILEISAAVPVTRVSCWPRSMRPSGCARHLNLLVLSRIQPRGFA